MTDTGHCNELKDLEEIVSNLTAQDDDCKLLLDSTAELKKLLSEGIDEDVLTGRLKERGALIDKIALLHEYCVSAKMYVPFIKNEGQKERITSLLEHIQQQLDAACSLNAEITNILKQCISGVSTNLKKIHDGKSLMNTLRGPAAHAAMHFDISG